MQRSLSRIAQVLTFMTLASCGNAGVDTLLMGGDGSSAKTSCPGDHDGFYVCLNNDSKFDDAAVRTAIVKGLASLNTLVNSSAFAAKVDSAFSSVDVNSALKRTNYIVEINGYCDAADDALATAVLGGNSIRYNECLVDKDANGDPLLAVVGGVLLHEIAHNIGYTHPDPDTTRSSVPYYLGDLAETQLGGTGGSYRTAGQEYGTPSFESTNRPDFGGGPRRPERW